MLYFNCSLNSAEETKDEPFAWETREFLRKKLVGKEVVFTVEYKVPSSGREYGFLYLGKGMLIFVNSNYRNSDTTVKALDNSCLISFN